VVNNNKRKNLHILSSAPTALLFLSISFATPKNKSGLQSVHIERLKTKEDEEEIKLQ
jgi:hypothetical protein